MHIHFLDPYHPSSSPIHRLDGRVKFVLTLAFTLTAALLPVGDWVAYGALFALILLVEELIPRMVSMDEGKNVADDLTD
jgi:energy-coupling factor transporter transmembrane protein EcfT